MIRELLDTLTGRRKSRFGKRVEIGPATHRIDLSLVDGRAISVVSTLKNAGYEAYIVGGAVRDLLLGLRPKDFDVATNATPEQVKALFRRAFIIGRRFRIVHVVFGRGREHEVIEVSTFRAHLDSADAEHVSGNERTAKSQLAGVKHAVDASGRVLRDNVWGPQHEDAARRDFSINAMYYDPQSQIVVDYHNGFADAQKRVLRMIGDAAARYREDPVRIIRATRFAAKLAHLGFKLDAKTSRPLAALLTKCSSCCKPATARPAWSSSKNSAWPRASTPCWIWPCSARKSLSWLPPCKTPTAAWPKASPSPPASCSPACSGKTCAPSGSSAPRKANTRTPPCKRPLMKCLTPASATYPAGAGWPPTCAKSG